MKSLITADTFVPTLDGMEHVPPNTLVETDADTTHALVRAGKALYVDIKHAPKGMDRFVATERQLDAVAQAQAAAARAAKEAAKA